MRQIDDTSLPPMGEKKDTSPVQNEEKWEQVPDRPAGIERNTVTGKWRNNSVPTA